MTYLNQSCRRLRYGKEKKPLSNFGAIIAGTPDYLAKMVVAMLPIPFSFFGRLFLLPADKAKEEFFSLQSLNVSIEILLTAFGILVGLAFLGGTQNEQQKKASKRAGIALFVGFFVIMVVCLLFPTLDLYPRNHFWFALMLPNAIALAVLAVSVGAAP
jgi:hypothetical protein